MSRLAIIQRPPVLMDREKTVRAAVTMVDEAVAGGAEAVLFPEAFIPGYPAWVWRLRPGLDMGLSEDLHALLLDNAVDLGREQLAPLREAARRHRVTIVCGLTERDRELSRSTLYNTVVVIGPDGEFLNRHRKLMPTNPERMIWGFGDGTGLKVVEVPVGRIGTLMCWENYMPLARYALYAQGVEVYIAPTYDSGEGWIGTLQHIAREGCCWVIGCGTVLRAEDIPDTLPAKRKLYPQPDEWVNPGDSVVIAPGGSVVAGPMRQELGVLHADVDLTRVAASRRSLDVAGHYARPDIFTLHVNTQPLRPVKLG
jgi:nitrilase